MGDSKINNRSLTLCLNWLELAGVVLRSNFHSWPLTSLSKDLEDILSKDEFKKIRKI